MTKREKLKAEHRELANPRQFNAFLDGAGALTNREQVARRFDYDWHARKLTFDPHFPHRHELCA
jgi:hypothetical protein